jgi:hypothetical protein
MAPRTLIVSFAGHGLKYGGVPKIEFANFLNQHFSHIDAQFYIDQSCQCYHHGMQDISTNIDETVEYLKIKFEGYERVICLGTSAGGYAAILFGSLLNVDSVIAFIPQTTLTSKDRDERYRNLMPVINTTTKYHLFGDVNVLDKRNCHHISHCENIAIYPNVVLNRIHGVNLGTMKNSGKLYNIINGIVNNKGYDIDIHTEHHLSRFPQARRFLPMLYRS